LQEARDAAIECRRQRRQGIDPIQEKNMLRAQRQRDNAKAITFAECFDAYIAAHSAGWKPKHAALCRSSVRQHALPTIGAMPVAAIDTATVHATLVPIWTSMPETASRLRARIEAVLDWAKVAGHRSGDNPARWRGHLDRLLAPPGKVRRIVHRTALPYASVPAFMSRLRAREGVDARALELAILTAARTGEVLGARWDEFDLDNATWTVPAGRMKAGAAHRIPLSPAALEVTKAVKSAGDLIFPVADQSGRALYRELKRMGVDVSVHGFRSSFRDWAAEQTTFPNHVIEQALAHSIGKVEAAYRRSDLFEKRRELMNAWSRFCSTPAEVSDVIPLRRSK
jgi:integrase